MNRRKIDDIYLELIEGTVEPAGKYLAATADKQPPEKEELREALRKASKHCKLAVGYILRARIINAKT